MLTQRRVHVSTPTREQTTHAAAAAAAAADDDKKKERRPPPSSCNTISSMRNTVSLLDPLALDLDETTPVAPSAGPMATTGWSNSSSEDGDGTTLMRLIQYIFGVG